MGIWVDFLFAVGGAEVHGSGGGVLVYECYGVVGGAGSSHGDGSECRGGNDD